MLEASQRYTLLQLLLQRLEMGADQIVIVSKKRGKQVVIDASADDVPSVKKILHLAQVQAEGAGIIHWGPDGQNDVWGMPKTVPVSPPSGDQPAGAGPESDRAKE